jgi:hypothetical protein
VVIYDTRNGPNTHSSNPRYIMDCCCHNSRPLFAKSGLA